MTIEIEENGDIWTITHNRPEARNAMDPESADALVEAFKEFDKSHAKAAVFYGEGGAFCAGWDLKYAQTLNGDSSNELILLYSFNCDRFVTYSNSCAIVTTMIY